MQCIHTDHVLISLIPVNCCIAPLVTMLQLLEQQLLLGDFKMLSETSSDEVKFPQLRG